VKPVGVARTTVARFVGRAAPRLDEGGTMLLVEILKWITIVFAVLMVARALYPG